MTPVRWLLVVVLVGLLFRLAAISVPRMNQDEGWTWYLSRNPLPTVLQFVTKDRNPPLLPVVLKGWMEIAGHGEVRLRLPMAALGTLAVLLTFLVGRDLVDEQVGLGAAALYAVSFPAWEYDTWLRTYALLSPMALLCTWLFLRVQRTGRAVDAAAYTLACALLMYSHYLGIFVLLAHLGYTLLRRARIPLMLACGAALILLYAPWLPYFQAQARNRSERDFQMVGSPREAALLASDFFPMETGLDNLPHLLRQGEEPRFTVPSRIFWALACATLAAWGLRRIGRSPRWPLLALLLGVPLAVLLAAIALKVPEMTRTRYYVFLVPYVGMLLAAGFLEARWKPLAWLVALAVTAVNTWVLVDYTRSAYFRSADWFTPARWVAERSGQADLIVADSNFAFHPFNYYYAGEALEYFIQPNGLSEFRYRPEYEAGGRLPEYRIWPQEIASGEAEARMEGVERPILMLWLDVGSPVRGWFSERYGVVDGMTVSNYRPDGRAEIYLLQRR